MVSVISGMAAIWSLMFLTVERAWAIKTISKQGYSKVSMSTVKWIVFLIWCVAGAASMAPLLGWGKYMYEVRVPSCIIHLTLIFWKIICKLKFVNDNNMIVVGRILNRAGANIRLRIVVWSFVPFYLL